MSLRDIEQAYARRHAADARYHPLNPAQLHALQERERQLAQALRALGLADTASLRATELGCGGGQNLLSLMRLGFSPARLCGVELLPERLALARALLPESLRLLGGDARSAAVEASTQDLVLLATVLSSVPDDGLQQELADAAWSWLKPGGWLACYDFAFDNPANPDVRALPVARVRALWPQAAQARVRWLTLAPPLARRLPPWLLSPVNTLFPMLRTHRLVLLQKP